MNSQSKVDSDFDEILLNLMRESNLTPPAINTVCFLATSNLMNETAFLSPLNEPQPLASSLLTWVHFQRYTSRRLRAISTFGKLHFPSIPGRSLLGAYRSYLPEVRDSR